jgi:hypothetical protein
MGRLGEGCWECSCKRKKGVWWNLNEEPRLALTRYLIQLRNPRLPAFPFALPIIRRSEPKRVVFILLRLTPCTRAGNVVRPALDRVAAGFDRVPHARRHAAQRVAHALTDTGHGVA